MLRILGVDVDHIREMTKGEKPLEEIMELRIEEIQREHRQLHEIESVCKQIQNGKIAYEELTNEFMNMESATMKKNLWDVLREDKTKGFVVNICIVIVFLLNSMTVVAGITAILYMVLVNQKQVESVISFVGILVFLFFRIIKRESSVIQLPR